MKEFQGVRIVKIFLKKKSLLKHKSRELKASMRRVYLSAACKHINLSIEKFSMSAAKI